MRDYTPRSLRHIGLTLSQILIEHPEISESTGLHCWISIKNGQFFHRMKPGLLTADISQTRVVFRHPAFTKLVVARENLGKSLRDATHGMYTFNPEPTIGYRKN